jgi:hypothetical protein
VTPRRHGDAGAPFALGLGGGFVWNDDKGYRLVGPTRKRQLEAMASYDILQPSRHVVISLGASMRHSSGKNDVLEIKDDFAQAALMARATRIPWLWPHVRGGLGAIWTRVNLHGGGDSGAISDRDVALASSVGGGFSLRTPTRAFETRRGRLASLSFSLLIEGGYTFAKAASFSGTPHGGSADIARAPVQLGSLARDAPYLRMLGVARF